jgi:hypothetical protein
MSGIPTVRFQGIVYLPTEEDADKYGNILQNLANQILVTFKSCENKNLSFNEKKEIIKELKSLESDLNTLYLLDKQIAQVYDTENPSKPKLESLVSEINGILEKLKKSLGELDKTNTSAQQQIDNYKTAFELLMKVLVTHSDLLKEQNEYKINAIR